MNHLRSLKDNQVQHCDSEMKTADVTMEVENVYQILQLSARHDTGIVFHGSDSQKSPKRISYRDFLDRVKEDALKIERIFDRVKEDARKSESLYLPIRHSVAVLYFDEHRDNVRWFWAVIAAGYVPAVSPPRPSNVFQRKKELMRILAPLQNPIVLTTNSLRPELEGQKQCHVHTVETSYGTKPNTVHSPPGELKKRGDMAALILTTESSGKAKAVCYQHGGIIHALKGKIAVHQTKQDDRFLNYIGLDHVANLFEVHLHAMYLGAEQVHVPRSNIMSDSLLFLRLIHEHRISYTFATNFLLTVLVRTLESEVHHELDLSCIKALIIGGNATPIATCTSLIELLRGYGAAETILQPSFGMAETCAGCTYNKTYPEYEQKCSLEYSSQGYPTQAMYMRVVSMRGKTPVKVPAGVKGCLQVTGPALFYDYFKDPDATMEAYSEGWFKTGHNAVIQPDGHLVVFPKEEEAITLNGKKFAPLDFEMALEKAEIPGVDPSYTIVFPVQHLVTETEAICILYVLERGYTDARARNLTADAIAEQCFRLIGVVPWDIIAVDIESLPMSSLGEISRVQTQRAYKEGAFFKFRGSSCSEWEDLEENHGQELLEDQNAETDGDVANRKGGGRGQKGFKGRIPVLKR